MTETGRGSRHTKRYVAWPSVSQLGRGVRVYLGRFETPEERAAAVAKFREKYPDMRYFPKGKQ